MKFKLGTSKSRNGSQNRNSYTTFIGVASYGHWGTCPTHL